MNKTENNAMVNPPKNPKNPFNRLGRKLKSTFDSKSLILSVRFISYLSKYISKSETNLNKSASHCSIWSNDKFCACVVITGTTNDPSPRMSNNNTNSVTTVASVFLNLSILVKNPFMGWPTSETTMAKNTYPNRDCAIIIRLNNATSPTMIRKAWTIPRVRLFAFTALR